MCDCDSSHHAKFLHYCIFPWILPSGEWKIRQNIVVENSLIFFPVYILVLHRWQRISGFWAIYLSYVCLLCHSLRLTDIFTWGENLKTWPFTQKFKFSKKSKDQYTNMSCVSSPQCGILTNFLPLRFYVKSNLGGLKSSKMSFLPILVILKFDFDKFCYFWWLKLTKTKYSKLLKLQKRQILNF